MTLRLSEKHTISHQNRLPISVEDHVTYFALTRLSIAGREFVLQIPILYLFTSRYTRCPPRPALQSRHRQPAILKTIILEAEAVASNRFSSFKKTRDSNCRKRVFLGSQPFFGSPFMLFTIVTLLFHYSNSFQELHAGFGSGLWIDKSTRKLKSPKG